MLVSGQALLDDFATVNVPFTTLRDYAHQIYKWYVNSTIAYSLQCA